MDIKENIPLAPHTTIQLGGSARFFVTATSVEEINEALAWAAEHELPLHILAGGSNTIFADHGFNGMVLKIELTGQVITDDGHITVAAGEQWDQLVQATIERGLAGFENLSGIPGSVGATPIQNVGAYGQEVSQTITRVSALDRTTGQPVTFTNNECEFSYRSSRFKQQDRDRYIITEVQYQLTPNGEPTLTYPQLVQAVGEGQALASLDPQAKLQRIREEVLELRRAKSMVIDADDPNTRSCGSFFVNPVLTEDKLTAVQEKWHALGGSGDVPTFIDSDDGTARVPAAWLIEQVGFKKGERRGRVGISTNHPLALVNVDNGATTEIIALKDEIQAAIKEKFDIDLVPEPNIIK